MGADGLPLLLIFAGTQAISRNVLEAAYVDGASRSRSAPHHRAALDAGRARGTVHQSAWEPAAFDTIYVLTGGPVRSTETIGFFMFRESFTQFKLGWAAATLVLLVAVLVVSCRRSSAHGGCAMIGKPPRWIDRGGVSRPLGGAAAPHRHHLGPPQIHYSAGGG